MIITGNNNNAKVNYQKNTNLTVPEAVNVQAEINVLWKIIGQLETSDHRRIKNAFEDIQEEIDKLQPDKGEVSEALNRALKYVKKSPEFHYNQGKIQPHLSKIKAWLGNS